jgi:hypothetical protein
MPATVERVPQKWIRFCDQNALKLLGLEHDSTISLIASRSRRAAVGRNMTKYSSYEFCVMTNT